MDKTFEEIISESKGLIRTWEKVEQRKWSVEANFIELTKQVGDLAARIMTYEKYYAKKREKDPRYKTTKTEISDELADIIWMCIRLADKYNIDLEKSLFDMMNKDYKSEYLKNWK